jgi:hypothetical protein
MSRQEQAALMAWLNSFSPSRSVTAFDQLSDGSILMEVGRTLFVTQVDALAGNELDVSTGADPRPDPPRTLISQ